MLCCSAQQSSKASYYKLLGIAPNSSREEIRAAYISKIRTMHPDVSTDKDATSNATELNAAYDALMVQELALPAAGQDAMDLWDVFDVTEAEPEMVFVNPFVCPMDPLNWKELQALAQSTPAGKLVEDHLREMGLSVPTAGVVYLTPAQLLEVERELEQMEKSFSFETSMWWLADVLARAQVTNNRLSQSRANSW